MKRPPGLWLLLSAGVLWLLFQDTNAVRGTSLVFGRSKTTTTSTEVPPTSEAEEAANNETVTEVAAESNVTTPKLSGIPQIDYIYDPNLPKELNGYNLSDYPFFERVPEELDFKCDGLHDGFYASIVHKCQVYHHCLYGTRYDFLCANYTAFDQKTFICHFVSEVDCVNSKNFWHRNDALYKATTTTTQKPLIIYAPPPQPTAVAALEGAPRRPIAPFAGESGSRRRRPFRRRRPQYDYYDYEEDEYSDDEFEEPRYQVTPDPRKNGRRKRPRPRPRPVYDDEYEEYEDDRYYRRNTGRRNENRRPNERKKNKDDRRTYDDEEDDSRYDRDNKDRNRKTDDGRKNDDRYDIRKGEDKRIEDKKSGDERRNDNKKSDERKYDDDRDDDRRKDDTDKIPSTKEERRSYLDRKREKRPNEDKRRPYVDEDEDYNRRPYERPRKGYRRPIDDDDYDERPRKRNEDRKADSRLPADNDKPIAVVKPSSGSSVYDRPRTPPRIRLPVPKNEAKKFSYQTSTIKPATNIEDDEEYYDDYEEELPKRPPPKLNKKDEERRAPKPVSREDPKRYTNSRSRGQPTRVESDEEIEPREKNKRPIKDEDTREKRLGSGSRKRPLIEDYYDDEEVTTKDSKRSYGKYRENKQDLSQPKSSEMLQEKGRTEKPTSTTTISSSTTTQKSTKDKPEAFVRVVKRPFLPSRGGSPYTPRGLQPVGTKAEQNVREKATQEKGDEIRQSDNTRDIFPDPQQKLTEKPRPRQNPNKSIEDIFNPQEFEEEQDNDKTVFKPSPAIVKVPTRNKYIPLEDDFKAVSNRPQLKPVLKQLKNYNTEFQTTQKPKSPEHNPLDLIENEYDVTLNDALNPTLPNLPIRGFPTGFSQSRDFSYSNFQRPRYVSDPVLNSASTEYNIRLRGPARYETIQQNQKPANDFVAAASEVDYSTRYQLANGQSFHSVRQTPRITQARVQPYYTHF